MEFKSKIFITGFPGFIAERLVAKLTASDVFIYLLVQNSFAQKARAALDRIATDANVPSDNFEIVTGDITRDDLGIESAKFAEIIENTTDVFHLAAVYDLAVDEKIARSVNIMGTQNVNNFALKIKHLRRYNYVSTCYVAGKRTGVIREDELAHDAGFRNFYEETKYLAELEVEKLKGEIPLTIYRPSVVVGESTTGATQKYDGIYYLVKYIIRLPEVTRLVNVGNNVVRLNLVPVDFVVDGLVALSTDPRAEGKTIALADPEPNTTAELFDLIARSVAGRESIYTPPTTLMEQLLLLKISPAISGLPNSAAPYFFIEQLYDTSISQTLLQDHGVTCPEFSSYVDAMVDFVRANPDL